MPEKPTQHIEDVAKDELLAAIRKQADVAGKDLPRSGAAALRDLAEAYSILTAAPLPLLPEQQATG
jgi:hypothetical protein